jgi:hypothetical protein
MRRILGIVTLISLLPGVALAQGNSSVVGYGGFSMNGLDRSSTSFGGAVSVNLTDDTLQAVPGLGQPLRAHQLLLGVGVRF